MQVRSLAVPDAFVVTPRLHHDPRGTFWEWYRFEPLEEALGHRLDLRQANTSVSGLGVVRGVHYADVPPSQAKYVTCPSGAVLDVVVDLRTGSPTFGRWDAVRLDERDRRAVYVAEGLGHAFMALTPGATVTYLCSQVFAPQRERGIDPLDPDLGIAWPRRLEPVLSDKDADAPGLAAAQRAGTLPRYADCQELYRRLRSG